MENEFDVEVTYRQRAIYRIQAADRETAERLATERWQDGDAGDVSGYEWSELEAVRATSAPDVARREEDAELALRFLRERERLILRLGGRFSTPSANDAISADRVASDLGWSRPGLVSPNVPDLPRAAQALERLCASHRAVCFERPRLRAGERGTIRLYSTPEYLERLSATFGGLEPQAI